MALTLAQLVPAKTKEELKEDLLLAMQGVGFVKKVGAGEGFITLSGVAEDELSIAVKITTEGTLGVAEFQYSVDGGDTYNGSDIAVPSGGQYEIPDTGVTVTFLAGPGEAEDSFLVDDVYSFEIAVPTLPTTSWAAGSTPLTIVETDAACHEDFALAVQNLAASGFLSTAVNAWLDLLCQEVYDVTRRPGQVAEHTVELTDAASGGPHSIAAGQLVATTAIGLRFANKASGILAMGGTLEMTFVAERRGSNYNVSIGAINALLTTLPGVTITNIDVGNGTSLEVTGTDREADPAYRARAKGRWATLAAGGTEDAYLLWATTASGDVTRVKVKADPGTAGGLILLLAGPAGPVSGGAVSDVEDYIEPRVIFGGLITVESAVADPIAIEATVYVLAGYSAIALTEITENLDALIYGGTNSKDEVLPGVPISDGTDKVYRGDIIEAIQIATGVRNVDLGTLLPAADVTVAEDGVATLSPAIDITIVEV